MIDFLNNDGTGKTCIYGTSTFNDENLTTHKHDKPGMLCMANSGTNTNGCQVCVYPIWSMINGRDHLNQSLTHISNLLSLFIKFYITCKNAEWLDGKHGKSAFVLFHSAFHCLKLITLANHVY